MDNHTFEIAPAPPAVRAQYGGHARCFIAPDSDLARTIDASGGYHTRDGFVPTTTKES